MSSRHTRSLFGVLLVMVFALSAIVVAPASAKLTKSQKVHIRHQLRKQVKKNPRVIMKRSFLKKASLVDFVLPTTIRLNPATDQHGHFATSDDAASLDLGPSLGSRTVGLGGEVHANIEFNDAFDGGNLGDVRITLPSDGSRDITSTSVPLLTNPDTSGDLYDDPATPAVEGAGCSDFVGATHNAGVDGLNNMSTSNDPGLNNVGAGPYSPDASTTERDVVLRTGPLALGVAAASGFGAASNSPVGQSGGRANLFGTQPAGQSQVDVKVNLATDINSIEREVDGGYPNPSAGPDPTNGNIAALFNCRQAWTGKAANSISTSLQGSLKIAPAITADGHLRIAKVDLSSPNYTNLSLAACLSPYKLFSAGAPLGDPIATTANGFPVNYSAIAADTRPHTAGDLSSYEGPSLPGGSAAAFNPQLAAFPGAVASAPDVACNAGGGPMARAPFNIFPITGLVESNGAQVNVLGSIKVTALKGEVLIGAL